MFDKGLAFICVRNGACMNISHLRIKAFSFGSFLVRKDLGLYKTRCRKVLRGKPVICFSCRDLSEEVEKLVKNLPRSHCIIT